MKHRIVATHLTNAEYEFEAPKGLTEKELSDIFADKYSKGKTNCIWCETDYDEIDFDEEDIREVR